MHDHLQGFPLVIGKRLVVHPGVVREQPFDTLHERSAVLEPSVILGPFVKGLVYISGFDFRLALILAQVVQDLLAKLVRHWLGCLELGGHLCHIGAGVLAEILSDFVRLIHLVSPFLFFSSGFQ